MTCWVAKVVRRCSERVVSQSSKVSERISSIPHGHTVELDVVNLVGETIFSVLEGASTGKNMKLGSLDD